MARRITRRSLLGTAAVTGPWYSWFGRLAAQAADQPAAKSCILLWMSGGPSHLDTFDLKPDAPGNIRGEFRPIETSVPGIEISEHFPRLAQQMQHAALLRGMSTVESDHQLATYHLHTGYQKRADGISFPSLGAVVSQECGSAESPLPNYVCLGGGARQATRAGFLGPDHQPLDVTHPDRGTDFLEPLTTQDEFQRGLAFLQRWNSSFEQTYRSEAARAHDTSIDRAVRLMTADQKRAFDLRPEPDDVRERYGRGAFGQGCLMARRLVEEGVQFVEVIMGDGVGWDTHRDNFPRVQALSTELDQGMSALISDLHDRGRLESTLIIWMGEFGRTPQITSGGGRNHWARAWSSVLIGGGIRGGQVIGRTDRTAAEVLDRPISVTDFGGTICTLLGIDYTRANIVPGIERPIPIVDTTKPVDVIEELL